MDFSSCLCLTEMQRGGSDTVSQTTLSPFRRFRLELYAHAGSSSMLFFLAMQRFSYPIILPDAFAGFSRDRHIGSLLFPRNLRTVDATSPAQGELPCFERPPTTTNSRLDESLWGPYPVRPRVHVKICLSHPMKLDPPRNGHDLGSMLGFLPSGLVSRNAAAQYFARMGTTKRASERCERSALSNRQIPVCSSPFPSLLSLPLSAAAALGCFSSSGPFPPSFLLLGPLI